MNFGTIVVHGHGPRDNIDKHVVNDHTQHQNIIKEAACKADYHNQSFYHIMLRYRILFVFTFTIVLPINTASTAYKYR